MGLTQRLAVAVTLACAALGAANAASFNFSYTFDPANTGDGNPVQVTGSLDATLQGALLTGISNVHLSLNGVAFQGPLFVDAWNSATQNWDNTITPVISMNAAQNNFIIADTDVAVDANPTNYFWFNAGQTLAITFNHTDATNNPLSGYETADGSRWTVTSTLAVPEPESGALAWIGLCALGALSLRRGRR